MFSFTYFEKVVFKKNYLKKRKKLSITVSLQLFTSECSGITLKLYRYKIFINFEDLR